jgi:hypothetical protein
MIRSNRLAIAILVATLNLGAGEAFAARALLAELLARAPAAAGQPVMSGLALEACLRQALDLDGAGETIDFEVAAIDRLAAQGMFMQKQLDAELPMLGGYDEPRLADFQRRVIRHEALASKFRREFPLYQQRQKEYDAAVAEFDRDCSNGFAAADLSAAKSKLGLK